MSKKARVAIIGTGWWSTTVHLPTLQALPNAKLVAIADQHPETLAAAAQKYDITRTYTDYRQMLDEEELDGVIVAVWHAAHTDVTRDCLNRDLHVMLEKPMTLKAREAKALITLAQERQKELIIGYPWNYSPLALRAREVVQSGLIGEVQYANSVMSTAVLAFLQGEDKKYQDVFNYPVTGPGDVYADPKRSGGGFGHLQITHAMGGLFFVTGLRPATVSAMMNNMGLAVDVIGAMSVRCQNSAIISVGGTGAIKAGDGGKLGLQIHGTEGWLDVDFLAGTGRVIHPDLSTEIMPTLTEPEDIYPAHATATNLVDIILGRAANGSPAEPAWRTVEFLEAAYRSTAAGGMPINVSDLY
jgi:predicted dehydrogenase